MNMLKSIPSNGIKDGIKFIGHTWLVQECWVNDGGVSEAVWAESVEVVQHLLG
jgi:hypothetical protein